MTSFISIVQVLTVENEERVSKSKGTKYQHFVCRCILLDENGAVVTVGSMSGRRIPAELRDSIKPGTYTASFSLQVPDWGDDKGEIVSVLTGLAPYNNQPAPSKVAAKA